MVDDEISQDQTGSMYMRLTLLVLVLIVAKGKGYLCSLAQS